MTTDLEPRPMPDTTCYRCGFSGMDMCCTHHSAQPRTLLQTASTAACKVLRDEEIPMAHSPETTESHIALVAEIGRWLTEYAGMMRHQMDCRAAAAQRNAS